MGITVAQALKFGGLQQGRLLAGARSLSNVIEYVNIIEALADTDWETGWEARNHLLLTTFNAAKDDPHKQQRIVELFARSGAAALVFQQGIIPRLIPAVIQRAERLGLPLIEVPETVTYPAIITPLVGAILREKTFLIQRAHEIYRRLSDLILSGGGLAAIASALSELTDLAVAIADPWGNLLATTDLELADELATRITAAVSLAGRGRQMTPGWDESGRLWLAPLHSGHQETAGGFIAVHAPCGQLDPLALIAVEQAAIIAALDLAKQQAVLEAERRLKRDFIEDVLGGDYQSVTAILARARSLGWDLLNKRVVALIDLDSFEQYYLAHIERGEEHFQEIKSRLLHTVVQAVQAHSPLSIVADRSDSVVLLPHFEPETPPAQARRHVQALAEDLCTRVHEQLDGLAISIAIGGFHDSVEGLRHSYSEAQAALRVGQRLAKRSPILWYDEVALYVLLDRFCAQSEVQRWFEQTLGALREYDDNNNTELVRTLEAYFDANQSVQQAARQLFIHPKTLQYRLRRIEEILGSDPFSGDRHCLLYTSPSPRDS